jgi:SOS response regulatory protein OraA/RecX
MDYNNKLKPKGMPQGAVPLDQAQVSEGEKANRATMAQAGIENPEAVAEAVPESQEPAAQPEAKPAMDPATRQMVVDWVYQAKQIKDMSDAGMPAQSEGLQQLTQKLKQAGVTPQQISEIWKELYGG